jgi:hypothetical protein
LDSENVEDIDLKVNSTAENSKKNPKKTRFWKEKSVEDMVTLGPTAQATLRCYFLMQMARPQCDTPLVDIGKS